MILVSVHDIFAGLFLYLVVYDCVCDCKSKYFASSVGLDECMCKCEQLWSHVCVILYKYAFCVLPLLPLLLGCLLSCH